MDAIFTPIRNVNFHVENMRVGGRTDFDKLSLQIETDGTITPQEAFYKASEILINHFNLISENKEPESAMMENGAEEKKAEKKKTTAKKPAKKSKK